MPRKPRPQAPRRAYPTSGTLRYGGRWPTLHLSRRTATIDGVAAWPVRGVAVIDGVAWFGRAPARNNWFDRATGWAPRYG